MAPENLGTLAYVFSPENTASAAVTAVTGRPSKTNPVKVIYDQRLLESDVEEGRGSCTMTANECDLTAVYNFDTTDAFTVVSPLMPSTWQVLVRKTARLLRVRSTKCWTFLIVPTLNVLPLPSPPSTVDGLPILRTVAVWL